MGRAITGVHYTGTAAPVPAPDSICIGSPGALDSGSLAAIVDAGTAFVLAMMMTSVFDAKLTAQR